MKTKKGKNQKQPNQASNLEVNDNQNQGSTEEIATQKPPNVESNKSNTPVNSEKVPNNKIRNEVGNNEVNNNENETNKEKIICLPLNTLIKFRNIFEVASNRANWKTAELLPVGMVVQDIDMVINYYNNMYEKENNNKSSQ